MRLRAILPIGGVLALAACSDPAQPPRVQAPPDPAAAPAQASAAAAAPVANVVQVADNGPLDIPPLPETAPASGSPEADAINQATLPPATAAKQARRDALLRAEVLLARARFSPGVIDGQDGGNLRAAITAYETAHGLKPDGKLNAQLWADLTQDTAPAVADYTITAKDVAGPFLATVPTDFKELAKLPHIGFTSPREALAEKFHMDEALLTALNPGVDLSQAGAKILVVQTGPEKLPTGVAAIEVDKFARQVRAYGADGMLVASYPATVGSTERPAPTGDFSVKGVAPNPTYTYDPSRLTFGDKSMGKLTIQPGPNNPVGAAWIDLTIPTYGIHGAPDPRLVGKVASHGCVRLTNWDVRQLASGVKKGVKVSFVGAERPATAAKVSSASAG